MGNDELFRGQRYDTKEWVYGSIIDGDIIVGLNSVDIDEDYISLGEWCSVIKNTVGRYLGIKDKNGNQIFDNHIVFLPKVNQGNGDTAIFIKDGINYYLKGKLSDYVITNKSDDCYEIIGDIIDKSKF